MSIMCFYDLDEGVKCIFHPAQPSQLDANFDTKTPLSLTTSSFFQNSNKWKKEKKQLLPHACNWSTQNSSFYLFIPNFLNSQIKKKPTTTKTIESLFFKKNVPMILSGFLFHKSQPPPTILRKPNDLYVLLCRTKIKQKMLFLNSKYKEIANIERWRKKILQTL